MPVKFFDSLLNNTYEFPDGATPDEIRAAIKPLHDAARGLGSYMSDVAGAAGRTPGLVVPTTPPAPSGVDQNTAAMMASPGVLPQQAAQTPGPVQQQNPYPYMDAGALSQIGNILKMMDPVQRFPKVDRATAAALGNNFQPYMQARRQDIQSQQQERRAQQEQALREKALFMQQQRQEQERRDRLAYLQMLMDNNEREEQLALKRFQMEADRAMREEQRFQEEQRQKALPQRKFDTRTGVWFGVDPTTGMPLETIVDPVAQKAIGEQRAARSGGGRGAAGGKSDALVWHPKFGYGTMVDGVWTPLATAGADIEQATADAAAKHDEKREKMLMRDPTLSEEDIVKVIGVRPGISPEAAMYARQAAQPGSAYNPVNAAGGMQRKPVAVPAAPGQTIADAFRAAETDYANRMGPGPGARRMRANGKMGWEFNGMFYTDEELAAQAAGSK